MPSPIGHTFIGLSIYTAFTPKVRLFKSWKEMTFACFLANLPDLDYLVMFITHDPFDHRTYSHSLLFSLLVAISIYVLKKVRMAANHVFFLYCFCLIFSHVIADYFVRDGYYPSKVALFYPLPIMVNSPISLFAPLNWAKQELLFSIETLCALIKEFLLTALILFFVYYKKVFKLNKMEND